MARSKSFHSKIDLLLLGYTIPEVHGLIDVASHYLRSGHRIVGHSLITLDFIEMIFGEKGRKVALLHLLTDAKIIDSEKLKIIIEKKKNLGKGN